MKIRSGLTRDEKIAAKEGWHSWFAWYPVHVGHRQSRWFEVVERRGERRVFAKFDHGMVLPEERWVWEYRPRNTGGGSGV